MIFFEDLLAIAENLLFLLCGNHSESLITIDSDHVALSERDYKHGFRRDVEIKLLPGTTLFRLFTVLCGDDFLAVTRLLRTHSFWRYSCLRS